MFTMENLMTYLDHFSVYVTQDCFRGIVAGKALSSIGDCETRGGKVILGDCPAESTSCYNPVSGDCGDSLGPCINRAKSVFIGDCGAKQI